MAYGPPPMENPEEILRRDAEAAEQQRLIDELHQSAYDAIVKAEAAMREARRLMSFPGVTSTSWAEKVERGE